MPPLRHTDIQEQDIEVSCFVVINVFVLFYNTGDTGIASRVLSSENNEYERMSKENQETINNYGQNLMDILCADACDGHNVGRVSRA